MASTSTVSVRFLPEERQRLKELRQELDAEKDAQLKSKRDKGDREKRLRRFDMAWIREALQGFKVPPMMDLELAQRAVIRGIRYNDGFATELHSTNPHFTRAINAQAIMNNRIPDMTSLRSFRTASGTRRLPARTLAERCYNVTRK